jgi:hypothetical protein
MVGLAALALSPTGCGDEARPALLSDFRSGSRASSVGDGGGPQFAVDGAMAVPTCNLGPDGGVCACADQELVVTDPPTIYFVLDHSGSMGSSLGSGMQTRWQAVIAAIFRVVVELGPRARFGITAFPSDAACGAGSEVFPVTQGDAPAGAGGPVSMVLLNVLSRIAPIGGTPTAATLQALPPRLAGQPGKTYVVLATDGGPNCNPTAACAADQCQLNIENQCAAGENCCIGAAESCNDVDPTVAAVNAIAAVGVPVFVLGIPGSDQYAAVLDALAVAGQTARASEPLYYAVSATDQTALYSALSAIAGQITATCTLTLSQPPAEPDLLNVFLDGQPLAQQSADGGPVNWTLDGTTITVLGDACQAIQNGTVLDLRVVAGCPTVLR